jgi:hypothetical protein
MVAVLGSMIVRVEMVPFGECLTGGWCDDCLLPSVITQVTVLVVRMNELARLETVYCDRCGGGETVQISGRLIPTFRQKAP